MHLPPPLGSTTYMGQRPSELHSSFSFKKYDGQSAADPRYKSSPRTSEEEQTLPHTSMDDPTDQSEWTGESPPSQTFVHKEKCPDCDVPFSTSDAEPKNDTSPPNPFVYKGARSGACTRSASDDDLENDAVSRLSQHHKAQKRRSFWRNWRR